MAKRALLQSDYSRGTVRDVARHVLPARSVWKTTDYIPNHGAPLRKRGGWEYASPALSGANWVAALAYPNFDAGAELVGIDDGGDLWEIESTSIATNHGLAQVPLQKPVFFNDTLIIPSPDGVADPMKYVGGGVAPTALSGSPPAGKYALVYKQRLVLALDEDIYFSSPLDPETWDTANAVMSANEPIVGLAALRNAILIFGSTATEWIRGSDPPPDTDMIQEEKFSMGCLDARSIANHGETVIWANGHGVWQTDGAALDNLVEIGGIRQYWDDLMESYSATYTFAGVVVRGLYILTIMDGDTFVDGLWCDIDRRTWGFFDNFTGVMFATREGASEEAYMALRDEGRVAKLSSIFDPDSTVRTDADGTAVEPVLETLYYRSDPGSKRWREAVIGVRLADSTDLAYIDVGIIMDPSDTSYDLLVDENGDTRKILPNQELTRAEMPVRKAADGIGFRIRQVGASDDTQIYDLEAEVKPREQSR